MAPMTVSYLIIGLGLLIVFNFAGIGKSLLSVGIAHCVINLPICYAIIYSQFGGHLRNIDNAAHDLGASDIQTMIYVIIPVMAPPMLAAFLISATLSWDEFIIAFLLSSFDVTLPVMIFEMLRAGLTPEVNAAGTIVFAISVGLAFLAADCDRAPGRRRSHERAGRRVAQCREGIRRRDRGSTTSRSVCRRASSLSFSARPGAARRHCCPCLAASYRRREGQILIEGADVTANAPAQRPDSYRVSGLRPVPAHVRARQRRVRPRHAPGAEAAEIRAGRGGDCARWGWPSFRQPPHSSVVRRPAPARCPGPGHCH